MKQLQQDHFWRNFIVVMVAMTLGLIYLAIISNEYKTEQRESFIKFRDNANCNELNAYLVENVEYFTSSIRVENESYMEVDQLYKVKCK